MKKMLFVLVLLIPFMTNASQEGDEDGGDKLKNPWQNTTGVVPTAYLPLNLDPADCDYKSETETTIIYECDGGKVFGVFTYIVVK